MGQTDSTACASRACRACNSSDPTTDTVKIDQSMLGCIDKENAAPNISRDKNAEETFEEKENRHIEALRQTAVERLAFEANQREELDTRRIEEQQRRAKESERLRAEAEKLAGQELEERKRLQDADAQREQAIKCEQEAREKERRHVEAHRLAEEQLAQQSSDKRAVEEFLSTHNFKDVNFRRRKMMKSSYPLHEAVNQKNVSIAQLLLAAKADINLKNSSGETAEQFARRINRGNSHAALLKVLRPSPLPAKPKD